MNVRPIILSGKCLVFVVLGGLAGFAPAGFAQRLLVTTTAMSVSHEATRLCLHSVDLATGTQLTDPIFQQGAVPIVPMQYLKSLHAVAVLSREHSDTDPQWRQSYIAFYDVGTLRRLYQERFPMTWRSLIACGDAEGQHFTAIRGDSIDAGKEFEVFGRAAGLPLRIERQGMTPLLTGLSGEPIIIQAVDKNDIAVICRGVQENEYVLGWLHGVERTNIVPPAGAAHIVPSGLLASADGHFLFVLISGYAANRPSGDRATWVYAFDRLNALKTAGVPIELPGDVRYESASLVPGGPDACWVSSYTHESQCAYATCIQATSNGLLKKKQIPITQTTTPLLLAVGINNVLEVWSGMERRGPSCTFKTPLTVIRWLSGDSLVVGEAGRVHGVDVTTGALSRTVQFQTGWVSSLVAITESEVPEVSAETVIEKTPKLSLPASIAFRGETVGQDVKAMVINSSNTTSGTWQIKYDPQTLPWLVIHPLTGTMPGVAYLGVDPQHYTPGKYVEGLLKIDFESAEALKSSTELIVRVLPEMRPEVRRILWLVDTPKMNDTVITTLAQAMTVSPNLFAHRFQQEPVKEPLQQYRIVVVDTVSVERGVLTRKQALDYVAGGGALLLLASGDVTSDSAARRWLEPIGITILPQEKKAVEYTLSCRDHVLCRHWNTQMKPNGCIIESSRSDAVLVSFETTSPSNTRRGCLLACAHGLGRVAVLAESEPLANSRFASDLFNWLANPHGEGAQQDLDSDQLVDAIEDANGNNTVDPGETDYLNADTDGDGVPDGKEDANLNGRVDEGETSPLLVDSDGDGIADGAQDPKPISGRSAGRQD